MMDFERARPFMEKNHRGVIATQRPDGACSFEHSRMRRV